jgi:hypothetical protein
MGSEQAPAAIQAEFEKFDGQYPDVYALFVKFAEQMWDAGRRKGSSKSIVERIRWEHMTTSQGGNEDFKINNNFTSRYARKLIREQPKFADFFETRSLLRT